MRLPLPPSSIMDKDLSALSPSHVGSRIQNDLPKSGIQTSSSSSSSSPTSSCVYVQSLEDEHFSPKNSTPKLAKPAMSGFTPSKSDTDSNRVESMKFHNESFGPLTPNRDRDSDKSKMRVGIVKRSSKFSDRLQPGSKTSKASEIDSKELRSKLRLSIQADIEKEPIPVTTTSMKVDDLSPGSKSGFFKKRPAMVLTPGQLSMINDKVTKNTGHLKRQRSLSVNVEKVTKVGRSKLLQRISNIAARGSIVGVNAGEPAVIFKTLLKKVNPESLHKAEKDLKRRYVRKLWEFCKATAKVPFAVLTPDDFFTIFWNFFILAFVIYDSFVKPFEVCFYVDNRRNTYMMISCIISCVIFTFDLLFNFRTAFYDKGVLVIASAAIVKPYLNTNFKWDILVLSCDFLSLASTIDGIWHLKLMSIIRFNKMLELVLRIEDFLNLSRPGQASLKMVKLWGTILLVAHWIACFFHLIAYMLMDTEVTWLHVNGLLHATIDQRYVAAIYWSILTMTTVGYGDIAPVSTYERMYAILAMIIASAVFGYSMNTVATIVKEISFEKDQRREKISNVKVYMSQKSLGKNIQTRVKNYIQYIIDSRTLFKSNEEQFMDHLSQALKDEIVSEVNGKILANSKIFSVNFSHKAALNLAKYMKETSYAPEATIFTEGERTDCAIFFIGYGKIELFHKVRSFDVLEKGSQFGEISFFSGQPRFASAKSLFFSNLYSLARDVALENIGVVPSDFEMFHFIKDRININRDYSLLDISCFSCGSKGHMARDCDQIHFVVNKEETIQKYVVRVNLMRKKFQRYKRPKFNPRNNIVKIEQAAKMIQEDYSDFTLSDEELSQDSLDVILERNLIILPATEMNDMKARKVERRNKSQRYSAQAIMGEIIAASGSAIPRYSHASQNVTREEGMEPRPSTKMTPTEMAYFTIDKVENFEVYYPHFNIKTMIQQFEKARLNAMLRGTQGGAKAIVLKNFGSLLRDRNRRGTGSSKASSPVYFAKPSFEKKQTLQRRRKTLSKDQHVPETTLKTQMTKAINKAKTIRRFLLSGKTFDEDTIEHHISTPTGSYGANLNIDHNDSFKNKISSQDEATVPRKDTWDDKKASKNKARVFNFEALSEQHTMTKVKLEHLDTNALNSSVRASGTLGSPSASQSKYARKSKTNQSSKKGTLVQHMLTKQSLDDRISIFNIGNIKNEEIEHALMHAMVKEDYLDGSKPVKRAKRGRAYSLERLDDIKKAISKYKMPKIIRGLMDAAAPPKTANFMT